MLEKHFHIPPANTTDTTSSGGRNMTAQRQLFDAYLWLTQLQQARCYETAIGVWRRRRSEAARTMGVLYWQLNDVWQGPSWSTIEVSPTYT